MFRKSNNLFTAILLFIALAGSAGASDWSTSDGSCFTQGDKLISAGLSVWYFGLYAGFDYAVHDAISVGGGLGYNGYSPNLNYRYNYVPVLIRGAFHPFNLSVLADKIVVRNMIDVYIGVTTGWRFGWYSDRGDNRPYTYTPSSNDMYTGYFFPREYVGARYFFKDNIALFVEHCPGLSDISGGISFKF
jgi:opacity protein-like surface antigen